MARLMRGLSGAFLVAALAAGRAAAEEAEGEGEEPDPTTKRKRQAHTIIVIGSGLVGISLAFEKARETLEEATSENMKPILNSIFAELTLLGFIGLVIFIVFQQEAINALSEELFGEEEEIKELSESVHMVLFLVMVIFLAMDISFVKIGGRIEKTWQSWEHVIVSRQDQVIEQNIQSYRDLSGPLLPPRPGRGFVRALVGDLSSRLGALFQFKFASGYRIMLYGLMRKSFIAVDLEAKEGVDLTFDFANYCAMALGHTIAELVEVPFWNWIGLEALFLVIWQVDLHVTDFYSKLAMLLGLGFTMPLFLSVVHAKIRAIESGHVKPLIVAMRDHPEHRHLLRGMSRESQTETLGGVELEVDDDVDTPPPPPAPGVAPTPRTLKRRSSNYLKWVPERKGSQEHVNEEKHHKELFWGRDRRVMLSFVRLPLLVTSIYLALLVIVFLPTLYGFATEEEEEEADAAAEGGEEGAAEGYGSAAPPAAAERGEAEDDASLAAADLAFAALVSVVALLPAAFMMLKTPLVLQDYVMVSHVSSMRNNRFVEMVLRRQKTFAAFSALKVVQCLRDTKMMIKVLEHRARTRTPQSAQSAGRGGGGGFFRAPVAAGAPPVATPPRGGVYVAVVEDDDEDDEERVLNQRDERLWRNIFAIFDDDGSGAISLEEMGSIMRDLCGCTANHQEIAHVLSLLDENHNGELDFDEFYFFVKKMEKYVAAEETPERIVSEMFDLIDTDASGEITVAELASTMQKLKQELAVDDIYEMMKDFDEDGGGALDKEEFGELVKRVGIFGEEDD